LAESKRRSVSPDEFFTIDEDTLPLFFAEVDVARARELFGKLNLQSAPVLILVPPKIDGGDKVVKVNTFFPVIQAKISIVGHEPAHNGRGYRHVCK